jgi:hypothetical protein
MSVTLCIEEPQVTEGYRVFGDMHVRTCSLMPCILAIEAKA